MSLSSLYRYRDLFLNYDLTWPRMTFATTLRTTSSKSASIDGRMWPLPNSNLHNLQQILNYIHYIYIHYQTLEKHIIIGNEFNQFSDDMILAVRSLQNRRSMYTVRGPLLLQGTVTRLARGRVRNYQSITVWDQWTSSLTVLELNADKNTVFFVRVQTYRTAVVRLVNPYTAYRRNRHGGT